MTHIWEGLHGVVLTSVSGAVLTTSLVLTGSLAVPIVAHYLLNVCANGSRVPGIEF